jgi:hypothetical protein
MDTAIIIAAVIVFILILTMLGAFLMMSGSSAPPQQYYPPQGAQQGQQGQYSPPQGTPGNSAVSSFTAMQGQDYNGGDLGQSSATTLEGVAQDCLSRSNCRGFNYPGRYMKSSLTNMVGANGSTMYVRK